jgi:hypothetical protein
MAPEASARLKSVLKVGDTLALFPVLKDWPTDELQALLKDIEEFTVLELDSIDERCNEAATRFNASTNPRLARAVDRLRNEKKFLVIAVLAEIGSVAIYYLDQRGAEIEILE